MLAVALAAFALVLTGRVVLPMQADLLPIPPISSAAPQVVVVETGPPPAAASRTNPTPISDPSATGEAILVSGASADASTVPVPSSTPVEVPVIDTTRSGYVRNGRVTLSLGWTHRAGVSTAVERRLAQLSYGSCG